MEGLRANFERWATNPPREWDVTRSGPEGAWPGQYAYHVQCAWEAWLEVASYIPKAQAAVLYEFTHGSYVMPADLHLAMCGRAKTLREKAKELRP